MEHGVKRLIVKEIIKDKPEVFKLLIKYMKEFKALMEASSCKEKLTEYEKLELLHSQLDELINGNQLPVDELKILQSFVEDGGLEKNI